VIQKNPSRAGASRSDPTVGKVEAWARRQGFASVCYANLFAFRSPHPAQLNAVGYDDAVGPENDAAICTACVGASYMVLAWGNPNGIRIDRYQQRIGDVLALLVNRVDALWCVGSPTAAGYPRHGLHWNGACELRAWPRV
jgi:hypothetical protein